MRIGYTVLSTQLIQHVVRTLVTQYVVDAVGAGVVAEACYNSIERRVSLQTISHLLDRDETIVVDAGFTRSKVHVVDQTVVMTTDLSNRIGGGMLGVNDLARMDGVVIDDNRIVVDMNHLLLSRRLAAQDTLNSHSTLFSADVTLVRTVYGIKLDTQIQRYVEYTVVVLGCQSDASSVDTVAHEVVVRSAHTQRESTVETELSACTQHQVSRTVELGHLVRCVLTFVVDVGAHITVDMTVLTVILIIKIASVPAISASGQEIQGEDSTRFVREEDTHKVHSHIASGLDHMSLQPHVGRCSRLKTANSVTIVEALNTYRPHRSEIIFQRETRRRIRNRMCHPELPVLVTVEISVEGTETDMRNQRPVRVPFHYFLVLTLIVRVITLNRLIVRCKNSSREDQSGQYSEQFFHRVHNSGRKGTTFF